MPGTEPRPDLASDQEELGHYQIRPYRRGDEHAILHTFNRVFAADGGQPRSLAEWNWVYAGNPAGLRAWVALDGELVVAHYASQPRRTLVEGREGIFAQIVDSMVHPDYRRSLKRPGLFVETGRRMLSRTCGAGRDLVAYGWPTPQAFRVGQRLLGYHLVREEIALSRAPGEGPSELPRGVELVHAFDARIRRLYERCAIAWGASTVRDALYLGWRVLRRPGAPYRVLTVRAPGGELAGYAVFRTSDVPRTGLGVVCDWLVPDEDRATGELLLAALLAEARRAGVTQLLALFPPWSPWHERFREQGFYAGDSGYVMVSGSYNDPRYDAAWLRERWWYQPLDLDLF